MRFGVSGLDVDLGQLDRVSTDSVGAYEGLGEWLPRYCTSSLHCSSFFGFNQFYVMLRILKGNPKKELQWRQVTQTLDPKPLNS